MIENSKITIGIEYERDGVKRAVYGEADENKVKELRKGEESYILLMNDGEPKWVDKQAILSVSELETRSRLYEKDGLENVSFAVKKELRIMS